MHEKYGTLPPEVMQYIHEREQQVTYVETTVQPAFAVIYNGFETVASASHPWYVRGDWKHSEDLKPGDVLLCHDGNEVEVARTVDMAVKVPVYLWTVEPDHNFYAAGVLHHNLQPDFKPHWGPGGSGGSLGSGGQAGGA